MNRDSNIYTFLFVGIMVIGIASILAFTSQTLKPMQKENVKNEKMQNILSTVGTVSYTHLTLPTICSV